jgi:hypothetical protein
MEARPLEIEGTWEQIAALSPAFAGHRLRVTVLPRTGAEPEILEKALSIEEKIAAIWADMPEEEWAKFPEDFSDQLDHYIYGTPTRRRGLIGSR